MSLWGKRKVVSSGAGNSLAWRIAEGGCGKKFYKRATADPYAPTHAPEYERDNATHRYFFAYGSDVGTVRVDRYTKDDGDITFAKWVDGADLSITGKFQTAFITDEGVVTVYSELTEVTSPYGPLELHKKTFNADYSAGTDTLIDFIHASSPCPPTIAFSVISPEPYHTHWKITATLMRNLETDETTDWVCETSATQDFATLIDVFHVGDFTDGSEATDLLFWGWQGTDTVKYVFGNSYYFRVRCTMNGVDLVSDVIKETRGYNAGWDVGGAYSSGISWSGDVFTPFGDWPRGYADAGSVYLFRTRYNFIDAAASDVYYYSDTYSSMWEEIADYQSGTPVVIESYNLNEVPYGYYGDLEVLDDGDIRYMIITNAGCPPLLLVKSSGAWAAFLWTPAAGLSTNKGAYCPHLYKLGSDVVYLSSYAPATGTGKKVVYIPLSASGFGTATVWSYAGVINTYGTFQNCQVSYDHKKLFQYGRDDAGNLCILTSPWETQSNAVWYMQI